MKHTEHEFDTHIMLSGERVPARCRYAHTLAGDIVPFKVKANGHELDADNWKRRLREEATDHFISMEG